MAQHPSRPHPSPRGGGGGRKEQDLSEYAWLVPFLPAFLYFVVTRTVLSTHRGGFGRTYDVAANAIRLDGLGPEEGEADVRKVLGGIFHLKTTGGGGGGDGGSGSDNDDDRDRVVPLIHPLETVLSGPPLRSLRSLLWAHDPELGRGYLLLSDSAISGRIWRWEVGGGPITIGRSLHMEWSGCRSGLWRGDCPDNNGATSGNDEAGGVEMGSAGLAIEIAKGAESHRTGKLVVMERGERRVVRIEDDGARTPLAVEVPSPCACVHGGGGGAAAPRKLRMGGNGLALYGPFGDLLFSDEVECLSPSSDSEALPTAEAETETGMNAAVKAAGVYRLREAVHVPPIPASMSRAAHGWNRTTAPGDEAMADDGRDNVELLYSGMEFVSGMSLRHDAEKLYVAGIRKADGRAVIVRLPLDDDDDDDDEDNKQEGEEDEGAGKIEGRPTSEMSDEAAGDGPSGPIGLFDARTTVFHDLTDLFSPSSSDGSSGEGSSGGPAVAVDRSGNVYATYPSGILILDPSGRRLGSVPLDAGGRAGAGTGVGARTQTLTALEIGDDGYLYASTHNSLLRIRVKARAAAVPTDMVVPGTKRRVG